MSLQRSGWLALCIGILVWAAPVEAAFEVALDARGPIEPVSELAFTRSATPLARASLVGALEIEPPDFGSQPALGIAELALGFEAGAVGLTAGVFAPSFALAWQDASPLLGEHPAQRNEVAGRFGAELARDFGPDGRLFVAAFSREGETQPTGLSAGFERALWRGEQRSLRGQFAAFHQAGDRSALAASLRANTVAARLRSRSLRWTGFAEAVVDVATPAEAMSRAQWSLGLGVSGERWEAGLLATADGRAAPGVEVRWGRQIPGWGALDLAWRPAGPGGDVVALRFWRGFGG